jgi:hypothetical protein
MLRWLLLLFGISLLVLSPHDLSLMAQTPRTDRMGVAFVRSVGTGADDARYRAALSIGAGWNRFPIYWSQIEVAPAQYNWGAFDQVVIDDVRHGLQTNAILLQAPPFYRTGGSFAGLYEPVFADGSDIAAAGKQINPNNPWARFVFSAVNRYKPGGDLARAQGWGGSTGVRVWEMWNEPDLPQFWQGSIDEYARLLKVGYIAAHHADPNADVMVGGLLFNTPVNWLERILAIYATDPQRTRYRWYMDIVGVHSYSYPWRTGHLVRVVDQSLARYGLERPVYITESGLNVWDDYPGPIWAQSLADRYKRGTQEQQAWYIVQSMAYGWANGADVIFHHQLYDDCGDQVAGTDFPPHNGEFCAVGACYGDAYGLFRNPRGSVCFSQHPNPASPRLAADAYRMVADVFGAAPFRGGTVTRSAGITMISFERPSTSELIRVIWNRRFEPNTARIETTNTSAALYQVGSRGSISAEAGAFRIPLAAARPDNFPDAELDSNDISSLGGEPVILVEFGTGLNIVSGDDTSTIAPDDPVRAIPLQPTPIPSSEQLFPTPGAVLVVPEATPALASDDTTPPVPYVDPLPATSATTFAVRWGADDDGAIARYVVWVQIDDGEWSPWLETTRTEGFFTAEAGSVVRFAVWALDTGGNWSLNTTLTPQAETRVE